MNVLKSLLASWTENKATFPATALTVQRVNLNQHADAVVVNRGTPLTASNVTTHDPDHNTLAEAFEPMAVMSEDDEVDMAMRRALESGGRETTAVVFMNSARFEMDDREIVQRVNNALQASEKSFAPVFGMP